MATRRADQQHTTDSVDFALGRARGSPAAKSLLEWQARLVETQETLARADLRHRGWQIISERVGAVLKLLMAIVGIFILIGVGSFFWSARQSGGMVVDAFSVPPTMDQRGLTGAVVAGQLLDKMSALESSTQSARAVSSYENSWSDTDGVQVPYTGVSLAELRREARAWLGSETHLKGDVVQLGGDRVAISFRAGKAAGRVEGSNAEFDKLLEQAALRIFKATQPYRYNVWLGRNGGSTDEMRTVLTSLSHSPELQEKLWALHGLAMRAGTDAEYVAIYKRALALQPDFLPAVGNMAFLAVDLGHDEVGLLRMRQAAAALRRGQEDYNRDTAAGYALVDEAAVAEYTGDMNGRVELMRQSLEHGADAVNNAWRPFNVALAIADLHDFTGAREVVDAAGMSDPARRAELDTAFGPFPSNRELLARATDDNGALAQELQPQLDHYTAEIAKPDTSDLSKRDVESNLRLLRPQLGLALARSGHAAEAAAVIAPQRADSDPGLRARALIAAYLGKARESDALFAAAVARGPSLPRPHLMWAEALLRRGDTLGAIDQARLANAKGPRWAEPLKLWGDALLARRQPAAAEAKYAAAAGRAPRWGRLQMAWAEALWGLHRRDQAMARLRAAAGMDLSPADRRLLKAMWDGGQARLTRA